MLRAATLRKIESPPSQSPASLITPQSPGGWCHPSLCSSSPLSSPVTGFLSPNDLTFNLHFYPPIAFFTCFLRKTQLACLSIKLNVAESSCFFFYSAFKDGRSHLLHGLRPLSCSLLIFPLFLPNIAVSSSCSASFTSLPILSLRFDVQNHFQPWTPHERQQALAITGCRKKQATARTEAAGGGVKMKRKGQGRNGD